MNIICNSCVGARIYQQTYRQFNNPFMWVSMDADNLIYLMTHYRQIDFSKFEIELSNKFPYTKISFDNVLTTYYIHYRAISDTTCYKKDINIIGSEDSLREYIEFHFSERISRLNEENEEPIFILDATNKNDGNGDRFMHFESSDIKRFLEVEVPYKKFVIYPMDQTEDSKTFSDDRRCLMYPEPVGTPTRARMLLEKYPEIIS